MLLSKYRYSRFVAKSAKKINANTWEVTLKSGYKFSDGTAVTAQLVADCLTELKNVPETKYTSLATFTMTAPSDLVVKFASTKPAHIMESVLAEFAFVVYKKIGNKFVFTGPYAVDKFVDGKYIDLKPNEHYADNHFGKRPNIQIKLSNR